MKAPAEHQVYLSKRNYPLECSQEIFGNEELELLSKFGFWMEALVKGLISPITDEQKRLIDVHAGKVEPISTQECAWRKLVERRNWEKSEKDAPHYKLIDESEQWFSRSDWKKMRS